MLSEVKELLKKDFDEIKSSSDSLILLRCYSLLYLNGAQPKTCEASQREYFTQLLKDGIMKAEQFEEINSRTCEPKWQGLKFIPSQGRHFSDKFITDIQATNLLQKGILKESDFKKLPALYIEEKQIEEQILKEQEEPKTEQPKVKKTKSKKAN